MESLSLSALADEHLDTARSRSAGRSAVTVHGRHDYVMRQTLIAIAGGHALAKHESPPEATLQVLRGTVRLSSAGDSWEGEAGDLLVIPPERHDLAALADSVVLLTVATRAT